MNSAGAHVVNFSSVVPAKGVLDAQVPVDRIRILNLIRDPIRGEGKGIGPGKISDAAAVAAGVFSGS